MYSDKDELSIFLINGNDGSLKTRVERNQSVRTCWRRDEEQKDDIEED